MRTAPMVGADHNHVSALRCASVGSGEIGKEARPLVIPGVRMRIVFLVALCAAAVPGCQESGFDEAKETARPLKVQHLLGESKVPGQAEAPASLSVEALDDTLALDVEPVAARVPGAKLPAYLRSRARGLRLLERGTPPPEDADLIIASAPQSRDQFAELSRLAPTVVIDDGGAQWKLNLRLVGEALGRTNDAEALLTAYDEQLAQVRKALPGVAKVAGRFADDSFAAAVLADAGVELVPRGQAGAMLTASVWSAPGGALAARAALADLQRVLSK
jgi:ABC-type Fe3+-hydroxamate transport system substrate-binding protein